MKKTRKTQKIDKYRVTLFKKKIKSICADQIEGIRLSYSVGKTHLIFDPIFYENREKAAELFCEQLKKNNIDFIKKISPFGFYDDLPEEKRPVWYISIPIDQVELPERKRQIR